MDAAVPSGSRCHGEALRIPLRAPRRQAGAGWLAGVMLAVGMGLFTDGPKARPRGLEDAAPAQVKAGSTRHGLRPMAQESDEPDRASSPDVPETPAAPPLSPPEKSPSAAARPAPGPREDLAGVFAKEAPATLEDLRSIETRVENLVARVSAAVVAVEVGGASGSGVVISEDGLVLSAAHVCGEPNRNVRFRFPDGKTARGKTLGTNHEGDAGMMRITDAGRWPHVPIGELEGARLGDWVLALGHPGGFDPQRPVVARLGRILRLGSDLLQTDCTLFSGDSGGPLFDMHGRVIGIHSRISDSTRANFHISIIAFDDSWDRLARGDDWGRPQVTPRPFVGAMGVDDPEGCRIERVDANGPASQAGLKTGDVVVSVNGQAIKDGAAFRESVGRAQPGDTMTLGIKRGGSSQSVKVTVEARRGRGRGRFGP